MALQYIVGTYEKGLKYRVFIMKDASGAGYMLRDIPTEEIIEHLNNGGKIENAVVENGKLKLTQGAFSAYPMLGVSGGTLDGKNGVTVLYKIINEKDETVGFGVCTQDGGYRNISKSALVQMGDNHKVRPTNWMLYTENSGNINVRAKSGEFPKVFKREAKKVETYQSKVEDSATVKRKKAQAEAVAKEIKEENEKEELVQVMTGGLGIFGEGRDRFLPFIRIFDLDECYNSEYNKAAQEKLTETNANLMLLSPYYSWMFEVTPKIPSEMVPTMAVTETTFYYNPRFLADLTLGEVSYILIHEMLHIVYQHSVRQGKRNPELWNIACDLYINEMICKEFEVYFGQGVKRLKRQSFYGKQNKEFDCVIECPKMGAFLSTIGETLDFSTDTAETIYEKLKKENPNFGQGNPQQGQGGGSSSGGSQGEGSQSSQSNSQSENSQSNGSENSQSSGGENGENDKSQDGGKGNKSDKNVPKDLSQAGENVDGQEADDAANGGGRGGIRTVKVEVVYNGKKITGTVNQDLASNNDMAQEGAAEKSLSESKEALEKIRIKTDDGKSKDPSFNMGLGSAFIDRQIEFALSVRYNWRQILKKVLNTDARFRGTYLKPNSGYMQQGVTLPTRQNFGKPTSIKGLKLCIDVSGSIGDNELKKIFGEIEGIIRACDGKVDAEVIYWDTTVTSCGDFKDKNTFTKIKPKGCGGTDPICAFDYIAGKTRVDGKAQKTKLKDISLVVFFTDGCIPDSYGDYAKMFGNKTLWVIDECMPAFKPLFGRVAVAKLKKQ